MITKLKQLKQMLQIILGLDKFSLIIILKLMKKIFEKLQDYFKQTNQLQLTFEK